MQRIDKIANYLLFLLWVGLGVLLFPSCKKYLDKKSDTGLTTIERIEDLQALLNYTSIMNDEVVTPYMDASSDDYFLTGLDYFNNNGAGEKGQAAYVWEFFQDDYFNQNEWSKGYKAVNIANVCLEWIEKFTRNTVTIKQWDNVKGSAFFFRAFNFLVLSATYSKAYDPVTADSDLGIALRLGADYHEPTTRATVAQCYRQIVQDAKESLRYLPDIAAHPLRPSKAAAYGLLARTYLSMRIYDSAGVYADSSLQIRSELIDYNGDADVAGSINGGNFPFRQFNKETIFYAEQPSSTGYYLITSGNIDTVLYAGYANDDLRKSAFFITSSNGYKEFKGNYTQKGAFFGGIATDEMFLIRAECYARKEMVTEAMNDLNTLMIKRWKNTVPYPVITATGPTDALQKILTERRKELLFRGLRWMDIKRLNKGGAAITPERLINSETYTLPPNSDRYALPIPESIIQLTGIPQNAGWE